MNSYLILKWIHVLSSVLLVGTGFGSAYYMFFASRSGNVAAQAEVGRLVVRADRWFTAPAALVQPVTGLWLAHRGPWTLDAPWILWSLLLYGLAGACWVPVVWLQRRMYAMARHAAQSGSVATVRALLALVGTPRLRRFCSDARDLLPDGGQTYAVEPSSAGIRMRACTSKSPSTSPRKSPDELHTAARRRRRRFRCVSGIRDRTR